MDFTRFEATSTLEENKNVDDGDLLNQSLPFILISRVFLFYKQRYL